MEIQCMCGIKVNKKDFKLHYRNCNHFLEKYEDFDFKISSQISKHFTKKNASIIIFLLERYIKLIKHKIEKKNIKHNPSSKYIVPKELYNIPEDQIPFFNRINDNRNNSSNKLNNLNNFHVINDKTINYPYNYNKIEEHLRRGNRIIQNEQHSEDDKLPHNTGFIKKNIFFKDLRLLQERKEINFEILKQMDFGNKNVNYKSNDLTTNREDTNQFDKLSSKTLFIGSDIKENGEMIKDLCIEQYILKKGIINEQMIECLIDCFKKIFGGEWFMIIYNTEYNDIYYNLTTYISDKTLTFIINNKKISVIRYG